MRRLNRPERGASATVIAISLVFLIGFAGLAVDVGALYAERTELQKGAEAAVLAIAEDCGHGTRPCDVPTATATAENYIDANARDLAGAVDSLNLDLAAQEVTVVDITERSDGGGIFLPFFAQVVGFNGTPVRARASARWGTLRSHGTIPITASECDITDPLTHAFYPNDVVITVTFLDPEMGGCEAHPGFDADDDGRLPAGFGWLKTTDDPCETYTEAYDYPTADMWTFQDPGVDPARTCLVAGESYVIPIFVDVMFQTDPDCVAINPSPTNCYGIGGYAYFTLTGFRFPGYTGGSPGCRAPQSCITGYLDNYAATGEIGSSFNFGVVAVELTG